VVVTTQTFRHQADAAVAAVLMKNLGMTEEEAVADLRTKRQKNLVTYFGGYAAALMDGDSRVHIFEDDDFATFCGLAARLSYGIPRTVGQPQRHSCEECFQLAQEVRRDV